MIERWQRGFAESIRAELAAVFVGKQNAAPLDLRGIGVGVPEVAEFFSVDFQNARLRSVDLSYAQFSCSFIGCSFEQVQMIESDFDACRLAKGSFVDCAFDGATLIISANDAVFRNCSFRRARFAGRRGLEYGGRRVTFASCDFTDSVWKRVEFRAGRFLGCQFAGTRFDHVDFRGAKFDGERPEEKQFIQCAM